MARAVQEILQQCWQAEPRDRPQFSCVAEQLDAMITMRCTGDAGSAMARGRRKTMEDVALVLPSRDGSTAGVAVFDGHGGPEIAQRGAAELRGRSLASRNAGSAGEVACQLLRELGASLRSDEAADTQGSTATLVIVDEHQLGVAWLGDSDAVLCQQCPSNPAELAVEKLTEAHSPGRDDERQRIEAAGGSVKRLTRTLDDGNDYPYGPTRAYTAEGAGGIAVSRALGDLHLHPVVSAEPEASVRARDARDLFVLVASDGVWDVLPLAEACALVRERVAPSPLGWTAAACEALLAEAERRGSQDNLSAAVIDLRCIESK